MVSPSKHAHVSVQRSPPQKQLVTVQTVVYWYTWNLKPDTPNTQLHPLLGLLYSLPLVPLPACCSGQRRCVWNLSFQLGPPSVYLGRHWDHSHDKCFLPALLPPFFNTQYTLVPTCIPTPNTIQWEATIAIFMHEQSTNHIYLNIGIDVTYVRKSASEHFCKKKIKKFKRQRCRCYAKSPIAQNTMPGLISCTGHVTLT